MRVLLAPDCFTGSLTAPQAAEALAAGWRERAPHDELSTLPLSDGGPGFLDVLLAALGGDLVPVTVRGPLGQEVPATVLVAGGTAYVESAQACGLHLVPTDRRDPTVTSTYGVGQLVRAAVATGAGRVVVGLGGSGTNDGGAGLLAALGAGPEDLLARGGLALADLADDALADLPSAREALAGVDLVVATDVDVPLLGFHGASKSFAAQKGATQEQAQALEAALGRYAEVATRALVAGRPLLGKGPAAEPGAGAAGGLGFGLMLLGGRRVSGVDAVLDAVGFDDRLAACDLVVTGEGHFDWQSLRGKVVAGVASRALARGLPAVVVAGQVSVGRREAMGIGVTATYAVASTPQEVAAALADPAGTLVARAGRVARTWSPG